jgi:hypothetical protein
MSEQDQTGPARHGTDLMDIDRLKNHLARGLPPDRGPDCPADVQLASYLEGGLHDADHRAFEHHLSSCDWCLERVGLVSRYAGDDRVTEVPTETLTRAQKLVRSAEQVNPWSRPQVWGAAAALLLAVNLALVRHDDAPPEPATYPVAPSVRNVEPMNMGSRALAAGDGLRIRFQHGLIEWTQVNGSLFYQVLVVTDEGDTVWEEQVDEPKWMVPEGLILQSNADYFVRIEAYLSEKQAVSSEFELLKIDKAH